MRIRTQPRSNRELPMWYEYCAEEMEILQRDAVYISQTCFRMKVLDRNFPSQGCKCCKGTCSVQLRLHEPCKSFGWTEILTPSRKHFGSTLVVTKKKQLIEKTIISNSLLDAECRVMVIYCWPQALGFCNPGDARWKVFNLLTLA